MRVTKNHSSDPSSTKPEKANRHRLAFFLVSIAGAICGLFRLSRLTGTPSMQLFVAVHQAVVSVQAFQLHAGGRESKKSHSAFDGADDRVHAVVAKHSAEVVFVVCQVEV
jgi:hypothetical protein